MSKHAEKRNSIKEKLLDLRISRVKRLVDRVKTTLCFTMLDRVFIDANLLFPDSTLDENRKLAVFVVSDFFDLETDITVEEVKNERVKRLQDELISKENIKNDIANYFLIGAFSYSFMNDLITHELYIEKENEALAKAKLYRESAEPITHADLDDIEKKTKRERKALKKQIKKINTKKVEEEKSKIIGTIKITQSHILFFASVFSGLFLVGGFLYTQFLLSFLGINTSDFFDIYDYLSSSVDVIFTVFISTVVGMFFYFMGISDNLSKTIVEGPLDSKSENKNYWLPFLAFSGLIVFCVEYFYFVNFSPYNLIPIVFLSFYYITFDLIKLDKYIENKIAFGSAVISIFGFILYLAVELSDILYEVKNGDYQSQYVMSFAEGYEEYSDHKFFMANSKYAFLLDGETQEITVIPIIGIKSIQAKKSR